MRFKQPSEPFVPPSISSFVHEQYWAINEAVHVLVGWPKNMLFSVHLSLIPEGNPLQRSFWLPNLDSPFIPKAFGKPFEKIFLQMKKSIESGQLNAKIGYFNDVITYLISPEEIILWALHKELLFPNDLQTATDVHQIRDQKTYNATRSKVQRKIVAQLILAKNPEMNMSELLKDDLMLKLGALEMTTDQELKVVKRAINELFNTPGHPGRPPKSSQKRQKRVYVPRAIPEVMQRDPDGTTRYHFLYLKTALEILMRANIFTFDDKDLRNTSLNSLFLEFLQDPIVQLYLPEPSDLIVKFAQQICNNVIGTDYLPLQFVSEAIERLANLGVQFEWPIIWPPEKKIFEIMRVTGKICLF